MRLKIPFIDIHTHHSATSDQVIAVRSLFLQEIDLNTEIKFPFSAAIHPWHSDGLEPKKVSDMLEKLTKQKKLLAIGETGLDKACSSDYKQQMKVFELQLDFAEACHKPVIIHAVKSWNDLTTIIKRAKTPCILHGYAEGITLTRQFIEMGCFFSPGKSLFKLTPRILEAIQLIPLTSFFLETDESQIPIEEIYLQFSKIRNLSLETLKIQIQKNFAAIFTGPDSD